MSATAIAMDEAEVVVIGAGPSGTVSAAVLAELGHDVLILDKDEFPREKACGDGLMHPAVGAAERMGLGGLIESSLTIEASRVVIAHRRQTETSLAGSPGRPHPRCITRNDFDSALLDAAKERGARFVQARVDGLEGEEGHRRLTAVADGKPFAVGARTIIGADGATSRIRRAVTGASPSKASAYAVRQYFVSERPLDPILEGYLPLELDGRVLAGYGWVFPIGEHTANVGVGVFRDAHRLPPLTRVLSAFIEELQRKARFRFGDLEAVSEPFGSPVGIRSPIEVSGVPDVVLVGDAAGTTHALTGEGIPFAMRGGEMVARAVHARSRARDGGAQSADRDDASLWRSFPQLGIDASGLSRLGTLELNKGGSAMITPVGEPFLAIVKRMQRESAYDTGAEGTPAWAALEAYDPALAECLERANDVLLERLLNQMPFVTEVTHRFVRTRLGPMYAAVTIATASGGDSQPSDLVLEAAIASESVGVLPELLTMLVDKASSKSLRANNAIAVLTGDFAATRALVASAKLGPKAVGLLALACQQGCEGGMRDAAARFAPNRSVASWFDAARETTGAATILASQLGTIVAEGDNGSDEPLREYGVELGIAIRLAEEIVDLTLGDEMHPGREGEDLRRGIYPLPLLYALEADSSIPQLLARHSAESGSPSAIIDAVRESGALERAIEECARRAAKAGSIADGLAGVNGGALAALAAVPPDFVASRVRATAVGT